MSNRKIGTGIFKFILNTLHFSQIFLIFLSLFTIIYWVFELAKAEFIKPLSPFFEGIKATTHIFYNRTVNTGEVSIDFSFFVAALFFLICVWLLKFAIDYVEIAAARYEKLSETLRKKAENDFNVKLEKEYLKQATKENNFLFLIKFYAQNMTKDKFYDKDVNEGVEEKEKEVLFDFFEIVEEDLTCQKKLQDNKILLFSNDFESIDQFINSLQNILINLKDKYLTEKWNIDFSIGTDIYQDKTEIPDKINKLMSISNLGFINEIVCPSTFKGRYELLKIQKYSFLGQGSYQLAGFNEEIFRIKSSR